MTRFSAGPAVLLLALACGAASAGAQGGDSPAGAAMPDHAGVVTATTAADHAMIGHVMVTAPWGRATSPGSSNGGVFLTLTNAADAAVRFVGGASPVAASIEIHETRIEDGIARMAPVSGGLELPAGGSVVLAPGGYHIMLVGLVRPLAEGEIVPLLLTFSDGSFGAVGVVVRSITYLPPEMPADAVEHAH
jgi:copper(I)-binding protein